MVLAMPFDRCCRLLVLVALVLLPACAATPTGEEAENFDAPIDLEVRSGTVAALRERLHRLEAFGPEGFPESRAGEVRRIASEIEGILLKDDRLRNLPRVGTIARQRALFLGATWPADARANLDRLADAVSKLEAALGVPGDGATE